LLNRVELGNQCSVSGPDFLDVGEAPEKGARQKIAGLLEIGNAVVCVPEQVGLFPAQVWIGVLGNPDFPVERVNEGQPPGHGGGNRDVRPFHVHKEPLQVGELAAVGVGFHAHQPGHGQAPDRIIVSPPIRSVRHARVPSRCRASLWLGEKENQHTMGGAVELVVLCLLSWR